MPSDGVPGESREFWVQLLKTVDGLADGTKEWRNCFLATARCFGFMASVLEPCVLVLRGSQQRYHLWSGSRRHCWWWRRSLGTSNFQAEETFHVRALGSGKGEILSRWIHACWTTCLYQESGLRAPRKNDEGTIVRCKRDKKLP